MDCISYHFAEGREKMYIPYLLDAAMPARPINDANRYSYIIVWIALPLVITLLQVLLGLAFGIRDKENVGKLGTTNLIVNVISCLMGIFCGIINLYLGIIIILLTQIISFIVEGKVYSKKLDPKKKHPYLIALVLNIIALILRFIVGIME